VPHAGERAGGAVGEAQQRRRHILDAIVTVEVLGVGAEPAHVADEVAQHVDVVDAVLQQRAGAHQRPVGAPCAGVVTLDGDELVVAEHHGHQPAGGRLVDEVLGPQVGG